MNAIIIKTQNRPFIAQVKNYSKESCIEGIAHALSCDIESIEQITANVNGGIYGIKEKYPSVEPYATNPIRDVGYANTLEVEYGVII